MRRPKWPARIPIESGCGRVNILASRDGGMVDTHASGACTRKSVRVQISLAAHIQHTHTDDISMYLSHGSMIDANGPFFIVYN